MNDLAAPAPRPHLATGPRTPEGKAVASRNAMKHGLAAKSVVLFDEDPAEYEAFRAGFVERFAPRDAVAAFLVDRVASCAWRLRRVVRIEREIFERYESLQHREHVLATQSAAHAVMVDAGGLGAFAQLSRHEAAIERSMMRALTSLVSLEKIENNNC